MVSAELTSSEIQEILNALPEDLSEERYEIVKLALEAVGKIPYYWGGNANYPGYDGNNFGSTVAADVKGRTLKGLDCGGFLGWLYWTVGEDSKYATYSAAGFARAGTDATLSDAGVQPGDLFSYSTGDTSNGGSGNHCGLIVGVNDDGTVDVVHTPGMPYNTVLYETGYLNYERDIYSIRSIIKD